MKVTDIEWKKGKEYRVNGTLYEVSESEKDFIRKNKSSLLSDDQTIRYILESDFIEVKQLTEQELLVLNLLKPQFKWVSKDKNGDVVAFNSEPIKIFPSWDNKGDYIVLNKFNLSFDCLNFSDEKATKWR